jgi:hypothetical protein
MYSTINTIKEGLMLTAFAVCAILLSLVGFTGGPNLVWTLLFVLILPVLLVASLAYLLITGDPNRRD